MQNKRALTLFYHLRLGLPSDHLRLGIPTKIVCENVIFSVMLHA